MATSGAKWALKDNKNLREDELDAILEEARKEGPKTHLMMALAYNGAMRISELVHIRANSFNFASNRLSIQPVKKAGKRRVKDRHTGKMREIVRPLPPEVDYPMPVNVMQMARKYLQKNGLEGASFLFPGRVGKCWVVMLPCKGGHMSRRQVQKVFDRICRKVGLKLPGRGPHSLKHGRLTEVAKKTRDPYKVKELGRHESITMSDHYVKYLDIQDTVDKIGGRV
jgi:integrase